MLTEEIKKKVLNMLGEQVKFEGHFDLVINNINENLQLNLIEWIRKCNDREIDPEPSPTSRDLLAFFFKPRVTNIRGILTKKKNSYFIALFLDKHKYYDRERRKLGFR